MGWGVGATMHIITAITESSAISIIAGGIFGGVITVTDRKN